MGHQDEPGIEVRETAAQARANLRVILELCASGAIRVSAKTHRPTAGSVSNISLVLAGGDFYRDEAISAFAWPMLVQAGRLAQLAGTKLTLTPGGRQALSAPAAETLAELWRRWVARAPIDEFSRVEAIKGQRAANTLSAASTRRLVVSAALDLCPTGEWIEVDELFALMREAGLDPRIERNERALWNLYLGEARYGSLGYAGFHDWPLLQGRYTLAVLFEYAATLGLVDVAFSAPHGARTDYRDNWGADDLAYLSRYDGLRAIRVNDIGAHALGRPPLARPRPEPVTEALKVLPNGEIVALEGVAPGTALTLRAFAETVSERVWQLTPASLLAAITAGRSLAELRTALDQAADQELPATVVAMLEEAQTRSRALTDRGLVRLIECADPATAALIVNDRRLRNKAIPVGDRQLAVRPEHEAEFRRTIARLGLPLPAPESL